MGPEGMIYDKILVKLYMDALAKLGVVWEVSRNGSYILFHSVPTQMFTLKLLREMKNYVLQSYNKDDHSPAIFENVVMWHSTTNFTCDFSPWLGCKLSNKYVFSLTHTSFKEGLKLPLIWYLLSLCQSTLFITKCFCTCFTNSQILFSISAVILTLQRLSLKVLFLIIWSWLRWKL